LSRAVGTLAVALSLAPLATGSSATSVHLIMLIVLLVGAGIVLDVPALGLPQIVLSSQDVQRLTHLLATLPETERAAASSLAAELARADMLAPKQIPGDVVTMNSRVVYEDLESGTPREAVLVYPHGAGSHGQLSILAPEGTALLGLRVGQVINWPMPDGRHHRLRVLSIPYQPEAAGDYHL
jgi:regulator of nucleoside diphosphate kinase